LQFIIYIYLLLKSYELKYYNQLNNFYL